MNQKELIDLINNGREERSIEYKGPMPWTLPYAKKVITRAILAMSNKADGGYVVVGVVEGPKGVFTPTGFSSKAEQETYTQDDVAAYVNASCKPYAEITVHLVTDTGGLHFVVIEVREFALHPLVCTRADSETELRAGVFYFRSRRKLESAPITEQADLEEVLDLAVDKWQGHVEMRRRRVALVAPTLSEAPQAPARQPPITPQLAQEVFDAELKDIKKWTK